MYSYRILKQVLTNNQLKVSSVLLQKFSLKYYSLCFDFKFQILMNKEYDNQ